MFQRFRRELGPLLRLAAFYFACYGLLFPPQVMPQAWGQAPAPRPAVRSTSNGGEGNYDLRAAAREVARMGKFASDSLATIPRETFDPAAVVSQIGRDVEGLQQWVRERVAWVPVQGVLRGSKGTLLDRQGGHADRAVLLAALLAEAGHEVRLAHATLPADVAEKLLVAMPTTPPPSAEERAEQPNVDLGNLSGASRERLHDAEQLVERDLSRVIEQAAHLAAEAGIAEEAGDDEAIEVWASTDDAVAAAADLWWVQLRDGDAWIDLRTLPDEAADLVKEVEAAETHATAELPDDVYHVVEVRVVSERLEAASDGRRGAVEEVSLSMPLRSAEMIGRDLKLGFVPLDAGELAAGRDNAAADAAADDALLMRVDHLVHLTDNEEWLPTLILDDDETHQSSLYLDGTLNPNPVLRVEGRKLGAATDALGGLGAVPEGVDAETDLSAVWLEFETRVPGQSPEVTRREIFDLVGPAARETADGDGFAADVVSLDDRQQVERMLGLLTQTQAIVLPARLSTAYRVGMALRNLADNREAMVRSLLAADAAERMQGEAEEAQVKADLESALAMYQEEPTELYTAEGLRWPLNRFESLVYVDRPQVMARHVAVRHLDPTGSSDELFFLRAIDLVQTRVAVRPTGEAGVSAARVRVEQGVADAVAEAEAIDSDSPGNAANAMAMAGATLWPSGRDGDVPAGLPDADAARARAALSEGLVVVAPQTQLLDDRGRPAPSWWRVDPTTGDTLAVGAHGWGMGPLAEYAAKVRAMLNALVTSWRASKTGTLYNLAIKLGCFIVVATAKLLMGTVVNAVVGKDNGTLAHYITEVLNSIGADAVMTGLGAACLKYG